VGVSEKTQWTLSLYADGYGTLCVYSFSDPILNLLGASCVHYERDLRDKHRPMNTHLGLYYRRTENKSILLNHNNLRSYRFFICVSALKSFGNFVLVFTLLY
jgi:hypothetical protein